MSLVSLLSRQNFILSSGLLLSRLFCSALAQTPRAHAAGAQAVTFVDAANAAGVAGSQLGLDHGAVFADFNRDGVLDIFFAQKESRNYLFLNKGQGTFADYADTMGLNSKAAGRIRGVSAADYDNDGDLDLFICSGDDDVLYRNNSDLTFSDVTAFAGLGNSGNGLLGTWGDYDRDGHVDLYVSNWNEDPQALYRNNGNGTFTDVTAAAGLGSDQFTNLGLWLDYDNDGDLDIFTSRWNNRPHRLWRNNGNGTFTNVAAQAGVANTVKGQGAATADYNNDGYLDIYLASSNGPNLLFRNNGDGAFTEAARGAGVADTRRTVDCAMGDFDNNGWVDIYTGNYEEPNGLYFNNGDGAFTEAGGATADYANTIGATIGDYNADGFLDIYTANSDEFNRLYRNHGNANHWLQAELEGASSNRSAIGARVEVTAGGLLQIREVSGGSGYCNQNSLVQSFGLGANANVARLLIRWPSGKTELYQNFAADRKLKFVEGQRTRVDFAPPVISNVHASNLTPQGGATIAWRTNEPSTSRVEYGLDASYGASSALDTGLVTTHRVRLLGLQSGATYHYRVKSQDAAGNLAASADSIFATLISTAAAEREQAEALPVAWAMQAYPNPFRVAARVRVELPRSAEIRLAVFDLSGHELVELSAGRRAAGRHELSWEGKNREGRELRAGVYLLRLRYRERESVPWSQLVRQVVLLK